MTNYKIEGQCQYGNCENQAKHINVLDETMFEWLDVCTDCLGEIMTEVANEGRQYFLEWATETFDYTKGVKLTNEVFGDMINKDEPMITMFTYGILKYPHNIKREGGINIVEKSTVSGQQMHLYNSSFPITKMTGNSDDIIYGTLFDVPLSQVTEHYDIVEGYEPTRSPRANMYNRIEVDVTTPSGEVKKAQMYYANQAMFARDLTHATLIPTGNFDDRHLARSFGQRIYRRGK